MIKHQKITQVYYFPNLIFDFWICELSFQIKTKSTIFISYQKATIYQRWWYYSKRSTYKINANLSYLKSIKYHLEICDKRIT